MPKEVQISFSVSSYNQSVEVEEVSEQLLVWKHLLLVLLLFPLMNRQKKIES